jgi:hypothetical protein
LGFVSLVILIRQPAEKDPDREGKEARTVSPLLQKEAKKQICASNLTIEQFFLAFYFTLCYINAIASFGQVKVFKSVEFKIWWSASLALGI